jgi:putative membrane protein insertion efficiency factor
VKRVLVTAIVAYQRWFSSARPRRCRFEPTCSAYAVESIERYGAIRGCALAIWRLLRCNPFTHGGFDPVPRRFTLRGLGHVHPADYHGEAKI